MTEVITVNWFDDRTYKIRRDCFKYIVDSRGTYVRKARLINKISDCLEKISYNGENFESIDPKIIDESVINEVIKLIGYNKTDFCYEQMGGYLFERSGRPLLFIENTVHTESDNPYVMIIDTTTIMRTIHRHVYNETMKSQSKVTNIGIAAIIITVLTVPILIRVYTS